MIKGFSKLSASDKVTQLIKEHALSPEFEDTIKNHQHPSLQELYNQFSENTISNFYMPFGVAPGFIINGKEYAIPMVIEESSVVAAASKAAKFWSNKGGFKTRVISTEKIGQLFFKTSISAHLLEEFLDSLTDYLLESTQSLTQNMKKRGGGITQIQLEKIEETEESIYCLLVSFETADSMGANFINSCLEAMGKALPSFFPSKGINDPIEVVMAILSNYTPNCLVECTISCAINDLKPYSGNFTPTEFAHQFKEAVTIANSNTYRAVTHNKGIMNGIDAVVLATGNDFRAIEAGIHAYAARNGKYKGLTRIDISKDSQKFTYTLTIPLAVGTVGGLTKLHPMAKTALELLQNPNAKELMQIMAAAGMANNFSAVSALVTSGIQKGHMKMHLSNILTELNCSDQEKLQAMQHFTAHEINHSAVKDYISQLRNELCR